MSTWAESELRDVQGGEAQEQHSPSPLCCAGGMLSLAQRQQRAAARQAQPGSCRKPDPAVLLRAGLTTTVCLLIKGPATQIVYELSHIQTRRLLSSSLI